MVERAFTPNSAAILLTQWLDAVGDIGRFPVNVDQLALGLSDALKWPDAITRVEAANIKSFEGGLFNLSKQEWVLLYNQNLRSPGRILFTKAHEIGHYLLHRLKQESFECSSADMLDWESEERQMEKEADQFASNLLMPFKQFRQLVPESTIDFDVLSRMAAMFGVSLTAACLRWIQFTPLSAMLVLSRDGFMMWSVSTDAARKNGAYFATKGRPVELPTASLAANTSVASSRTGQNISLSTWFRHAHKDAVAKEMKLVCDNYEYILSIVLMSPGDKVWAPRDWS